MTPLLAVLFALFGGAPYALAHQTPTPAFSSYRIPMATPTYPTRSLPTPSAPSTAGFTLPNPPQQAIAPAPQRTPQVSQAPASLAATIEADVLADTNAEREANGLPALENDNALASIAQSHSADMLANNYFDHADRNGCAADCRLNEAGYSWSAMGENIHMMSGYNLSPAATAQKIVTDWMNSPGHRANMLNASYTHAGIGVALSGSTIYTTEDFAEPK